jgi:hypothetical protein
MNMPHILFISFASFGRNAVGIMFYPYETYRRIANRGGALELVYVGLLAMLYFALASVVKVATFRPFILTKHVVVLGGTAFVTYALAVWLIWAAGRRFGSKAAIRRVAVAWGYTMIPTVCWFFMTSFLYVVLPPPRTASAAGVAFSALFLAVSATLFFWKLTLGYLAIRFGLRLDLVRILAVAGIVGPLMAVWSWGMYRLGIFKVPFI